MNKRTDAAWVEIDVDTLTTEQQAAWNANKALYRQYKAGREQFEAMLAEGVPEGKRMIFGYNFGKLSVAIVEDDRKPVKSKAATMTLAELLALNDRAGLRAN